MTDFSTSRESKNYSLKQILSEDDRKKSKSNSRSRSFDCVGAKGAPTSLRMTDFSTSRESKN